VDPQVVQIAFFAVLAVFVAGGLVLRRAGTRATVAGAAAAPLLAWAVYEGLVLASGAEANVRIDWLLLFPITAAHAVHAIARWRRLGAGRDGGPGRLD